MENLDLIKDGAFNRAETLKFLQSEFGNHICRQSGKQKFNRSVTVFIRGALISMAGLTTVLLGVKGYLPFKYSDYISEMALVISAIATGLTAWETFSEHSRRWIRARMTLGQLHELADDLEFEIAARNPPPEAALRDIFARFKGLMRSEDDEWAARRIGAISKPLEQGHRA